MWPKIHVTQMSCTFVYTATTYMYLRYFCIMCTVHVMISKYNSSDAQKDVPHMYSS